MYQPGPRSTMYYLLDFLDSDPGEPGIKSTLFGSILLFVGFLFSMAAYVLFTIMYDFGIILIWTLPLLIVFATVVLGYNLTEAFFVQPFKRRIPWPVLMGVRASAAIMVILMVVSAWWNKVHFTGSAVIDGGSFIFVILFCLSAIFASNTEWGNRPGSRK